MRVTVERTFNLGNYENIRFTFDSEEGVQNGDHLKVAQRLAEDAHAAFEAYKVNLLRISVAAKKEAEHEAQLTPKGDAKSEKVVDNVLGQMGLKKP
jgi:hypothetical protein